MPLYAELKEKRKLTKPTYSKRSLLINAFIGMEVCSWEGLTVGTNRRWGGSSRRLSRGREWMLGMEDCLVIDRWVFLFALPYTFKLDLNLSISIWCILVIHPKCFSHLGPFSPSSLKPETLSSLAFPRSCLYDRGCRFSILIRKFLYKERRLFYYDMREIGFVKRVPWLSYLSATSFSLCLRSIKFCRWNSWGLKN